jgi:hypothetical protein
MGCKLRETRKGHVGFVAPIAVNMKGAVLYVLTPCISEKHYVSEEHIASIFRVK